jgi:hypothetical protein
MKCSFIASHSAWQRFSRQYGPEYSLGAILVE